MKVQPQRVISDNPELVFLHQRRLVRCLGLLVSWSSVTSISHRFVSGRYTVFSTSLFVPTRTASVSVSGCFCKTNLSWAHIRFIRCCCSTVEYTPQAYLQSDLQMFAQNYSTDLIGKEPYLVSIDGGKDLFRIEVYVHAKKYPSIRRLCTDHISGL